MRLLSLLLLLISTQTSSAAMGDCGNESNQMALNECAHLSFQKADAELNTLYQNIKRRSAEPQSQNLLVAAQRAWVAFRDAECTFATSSATGGSIHPMVHSGCLERLTRARIGDLKRYMQCQEGDLSCPIPPG
jgi:uncharacterized protein YecT (DUF1311 family)